MARSLIAQDTLPDIFPDPDTEPDTEDAIMVLCDAQQMHVRLVATQVIEDPAETNDVLARFFVRDDS